MNYNQLISVYTASKELAQKVSDELLSGAITLDTLLGNPSVAYTGYVSEKSPDNSVVASHCLGIGAVFFFLAFLFRKDSNNMGIKVAAASTIPTLFGAAYYTLG